MKKIIKHYPMTDRLIVRRGYIRETVYFNIYMKLVFAIDLNKAAQCYIKSFHTDLLASTDNR
jgi:hypothetical protein